MSAFIHKRITRSGWDPQSSAISHRSTTRSGWDLVCKLLSTYNRLARAEIYSCQLFAKKNCVYSPYAKTIRNIHG